MLNIIKIICIKIYKKLTRIMLIKKLFIFCIVDCDATPYFFFDEVSR